MGEARKRRLALIKGGKAQEAKAHRIAPERMKLIQVLIPSVRAEILDMIYNTKVDKTTCPTRNDFLLALIESGVQSFEQFYYEENRPKSADIELPKGDQ